MPTLNELIWQDLPEGFNGGRLIGSTGMMRRPHWVQGSFIHVESGVIYSVDRKKKERRWQPYCEDLFANDWEKVERAAGQQAPSEEQAASLLQSETPQEK